ncbi:MAG TPA: YceI family protein [Hanamia sp.]|nr:YceI family protein [Hanamia sp.]
MQIKNILLILVICVAANSQINGQIYFTKNGRISFFSKTILEDINADNNQVISILNLQTSGLQFSLLNNAFHFPKAKMEEDFNEDYMESSRYPRSTFKGTIAGIDKIDFSKDGTWPVNVSGELMIHGVTKSIAVPGKIIIKGEKVSASASFKILPKDYKIRIPSLVSNKIAESIDVTVDCLYQKK